VVGLTFVIGVLNVCLGYALAVYLGYGPPGLPESWQALTAAPLVRGQAAEGLAEDLAATNLRSVPAAENVEETLQR
jgi:hypothetical protein